MKDLDDRAALVVVTREEGAKNVVIGASRLLLERTLFVHLGTKLLHLLEGIGCVDEVHAERARLAAGAVAEKLLTPIDVVLVALVKLALAQLARMASEPTLDHNVDVAVVVGLGCRAVARAVEKVHEQA